MPACLFLLITLLIVSFFCFGVAFLLLLLLFLTNSVRLVFVTMFLLLFASYSSFNAGIFSLYIEASLNKRLNWRCYLFCQFIFYLRKRNCMHCKRLQWTMLIRRNTICMNPLTLNKPIQQWMLGSFPHRNVPKLPELMCVQ